MTRLLCPERTELGTHNFEFLTKQLHFSPSDLFLSSPQQPIMNCSPNETSRRLATSVHSDSSSSSNKACESKLNQGVTAGPYDGKFLQNVKNEI